MSLNLIHIITNFIEKCYDYEEDNDYMLFSHYSHEDVLLPEYANTSKYEFSFKPILEQFAAIDSCQIEDND